MAGQTLFARASERSEFGMMRPREVDADGRVLWEAVLAGDYTLSGPKGSIDFQVPCAEIRYPEKDQ